MKDNKSGLEGNIGIGMRHIFGKKDKFYGFYGFWDIRKLKNNNKKAK